MTGLDVEAVGVERLSGTLDAAADDLSDLTAANREAGQRALAAADIPVRTGHLKETAAVAADDHGFDLTATAKYAGYVHANNPFFTRALDNQADRIYDDQVEHAEHVLSAIRGA